MSIGRSSFALCGLLFLATAPAFASVDKPEAITVPPPPAGKAEVVFYRPTGYVGSAISCAVREGDTTISSLPPGRFFILVADPGTHTYAATSSSDNGVYLTLKAGEIHYVQCVIHTGFWAGKGSLDIPIKDEEFTTKLWKSVDPTRILSPNVLTEAQIRAASAAEASAPAAAPAPAVVTPASSPTGPTPDSATGTTRSPQL